MATLNTFVHVTDVDEDGTYRSAVFGPADKVPDWAIRAITNPKVWDGEPPVVEAAPSTPDEKVEPPRNGKGSGLEAWVEYAKSLGYEVAEGTSRDDLIAAIDAEKE